MINVRTRDWEEAASREAYYNVVSDIWLRIMFPVTHKFFFQSGVFKGQFLTLPIRNLYFTNFVATFSVLVLLPTWKLHIVTKDTFSCMTREMEYLFTQNS